MKYKYLFFFLALFLIACSNSREIYSGDFKSFYKSNASSFNPEYKLHHLGSKNYKLFFQFSSEELLYQRDLDTDELLSELRINAIKYNGYSLSDKIDSVRTKIVDKKIGDKRRIIAGSMNIPFKMEHEQVLLVKTTDLVRNKKRKAFLIVDSTFKASPNYMLYRKHDALPILDNSIDGSTMSEFSSPYFESDKIKASYYNSSFGLPAPPFSLKRPKKFNFDPAKTEILDKNANNRFDVNLLSYDMLRLQDTLYQGDQTLFKFYNGFPKVSNYGQMIEVIRYITNKDEHQKLLDSEDKKVALDDFWLQRSGSEERAKKIIKSYYQRAENANQYFTCHTQGWKTDRGLILIIFGEPKTITKTLNSEIWNYGEQGKYRSLNFRFVRADNPFSDNDFRLIRKEEYKPVWYYFVDAWRSGRIIN